MAAPCLPETVTEMRAMYRRGIPRSVIAHRLGFNVSTIRHYTRDIPKPPSLGKRYQRVCLRARAERLQRIFDRCNAVVAGGA